MRASTFAKEYKDKVTDIRARIFPLCDFNATASIKELHEICKTFNGIILEGMLVSKYKKQELFNHGDCVNCAMISILKYAIGDKINDANINLYIDLLELLCVNSSLYSDIYDNVLHYKFVKCIPILMLASYAQNHINKYSNEQLDKSTIIDYFDKLIQVYDKVDAYISAVKERLNDDYEFDVETSCVIDNHHVIGHADMVCDDLLIDIKVSSYDFEYNCNSWKAQLVCYNRFLRRPNIAIINLYRNEFIWFKSNDDFIDIRLDDSFSDLTNV